VGLMGGGASSTLAGSDEILGEVSSMRGRSATPAAPRLLSRCVWSHTEDPAPALGYQ
jgi:hypothetical protein